MAPPSDAELLPLIEALAAGDVGALRPLIERTSPWLHALLLAQVGDAVAAGVLLEESYGEIWEAAPLYDRYAGGPWTWLVSVARARGLSWGEKRLRAGRERGGLAGVALGTGPAAEALAALPSQDREALLVTLLRGLPSGEAGAEARERFQPALRAFAAALARPHAEPEEAPPVLVSRGVAEA